jgi:hypothetical protein
MRYTCVESENFDNFVKLPTERWAAAECTVTHVLSEVLPAKLHAINVPIVAKIKALQHMYNKYVNSVADPAAGACLAYVSTGFFSWISSLDPDSILLYSTVMAAFQHRPGHRQNLPKVPDLKPTHRTISSITIRLSSIPLLYQRFIDIHQLCTAAGLRFSPLTACLLATTSRDCKDLCINMYIPARLIVLSSVAPYVRSMIPMSSSSLHTAHALPFILSSGKTSVVNLALNTQIIPMMLQNATFSI